MKDGAEFVTRSACGETSRRVLEKLELIERRLFKDNGTLSIQTRLDRHERVLRVLLWAACVMAGTLLASWTLGLYSRIYFPPCLRHDFDCVHGQGVWEASKRFYRLQRAYGVGRARSGIRAGAVTAAWYTWLKWRKR